MRMPATAAVYDRAHHDPKATRIGSRPARETSAMRRLLLLLVVLILVPLTACGGGRKSAACTPVVVEQIDPNQGHLIAGAAEPSYRTWPPTSGPHIAGLLRTGVIDEPLSGLEQVSTLEAGAVIIQYRPDVDPGDVEALRRLASVSVAVAPGRDLPAAVVATGWLRKLSCTGVDQEALRLFVAAVSGRHQGHGATTEPEVPAQSVTPPTVTATSVTTATATTTTAPAVR